MGHVVSSMREIMKKTAFQNAIYDFLGLLFFWRKICTELVAQASSLKMVFFKISQNSHQNICIGVSFFVLKKRLGHRYFSVNFSKFSKTPFLQIPPVVASESILIKFLVIHDVYAEIILISILVISYSKIYLDKSLQNSTNFNT